MKNDISYSSGINYQNPTNWPGTGNQQMRNEELERRLNPSPTGSIQYYYHPKNRKEIICKANTNETINLKNQTK